MTYNPKQNIKITSKSAFSDKRLKPRQSFGEGSNMSEETKPVRCGCGGEAKVISYLSRDYCKMAYYVRCVECGTETDDLFSEAESIEVWNRAMGERTAKVETVEKPNVFKCSECGQYFHSTAWGSPVMYCSRCGAKLDWSGNE